MSKLKCHNNLWIYFVVLPLRLSRETLFFGIIVFENQFFILSEISEFYVIFLKKGKNARIL